MLQRLQRPQQPAAAPAEGGEDAEKANTSSASTAPVRCQPVGVASVAAAEIQTGDAGAVDAVVSTGTAMVKMMEGVMGQAKSSMSQSIQILSVSHALAERHTSRRSSHPSPCRAGLELAVSLACVRCLPSDHSPCVGARTCRRRARRSPGRGLVGRPRERVEWR